MLGTQPRAGITSVRGSCIKNARRLGRHSRESRLRWRLRPKVLLLILLQRLDSSWLFEAEVNTEVCVCLQSKWFEVSKAGLFVLDLKLRRLDLTRVLSLHLKLQCLLNLLIVVQIFT